MASKDESTVAVQEIKSEIKVDGTAFQDIPSAVPVAAWPTQPKPLVLPHKEELFWNIYDIALILLPVLLIVKTILCIVAERHDRNNTGPMIDSASILSRNLVDLNGQLVTLFTIVFVTIISTFVKRYALWKAQSGAFLSDLEQLQGSVSLPSTIKLIWSLRSFGVTSAVLVGVWSFYYLGSQAVKSEYLLTDSATYKHSKAAIQRSDALSFFSPELPSLFNNSDSTYTFNDVKYQGGYLSNLNFKLASVLMESSDYTKQPSLGSNMGALIPFYPGTLVRDPSTGIDDLSDKLMHKMGGWVDVSVQSKIVDYTSRVGTPVFYDDPYKNTDGSVTHSAMVSPVLGSYTMTNSSYLNITCGLPTVYTFESFPNNTSYNTSYSFNMTAVTPQSPRDRNGHVMRQFEMWWRGSLPNETYSYNITDRSIMSVCNITNMYVDMQVHCLTTGCKPQRMRWSNNTKAQDAIGFDTPFRDDQFASEFLSNFILSTGPQNLLNVSTLVSSYYMPTFPAMHFGPYSPLGPYCQGMAPSDCNDQVYSWQLSTWLNNPLTVGFNTYYMLSQSIIPQSPDMDKIVAQGSDRLFKSVNFDGNLYVQAYRIYWAWIPIDFLSCLILLAAAIGSYWLRVHTLAPDIFGFVSSLTRDNPNITLPTEGSTLSGIERARKLRKVKVKIGDLQDGQGENSVGRIGLAPVDAVPHGLHKEKVYV